MKKNPEKMRILNLITAQDVNLLCVGVISTTRQTHQSEFNTFEIESIVINVLEFKILPKTLVEILKGFIS